MLASVKTLKTDKYCFVCGNNGFADKECPCCHRAPTTKSLNLEYSERPEEFVKKIDSFGIPDVYRGIAWNSDILRNSKPELEKDYNFDRFVQQLEKVNQVFCSGQLSKKSAIIIAPAGFSKMTFAYSCLQRAVDNNFSVAPLLDTVELKRLIGLSAENPRYRLYDRVEYDDVLTADVMFVTVTKLRQYEWAYEVVQEIFDKRTRLGRSTFVISRFDLNEISRRDYSNSFEALADTTVTDFCKYPAIIAYRPFRGER